MRVALNEGRFRDPVQRAVRSDGRWIRSSSGAARKLPVKAGAKGVDRRFLDR
jgi:hypothetical protein